MDIQTQLIVILSLLMFFTTTFTWMLVKFNGGVKIQNGVKIACAAGGGGGAPTLQKTYDFESATWQADDSWTGHLNTAWGTDVSAQFTRGNTQVLTGSYSCDINPTGGSVNLLTTNYGSEPDYIIFPFYNQTARDKIFGMYGVFQNGGYAGGPWIYMDMNAPLLAIGAFQVANGQLGAALDSDSTMSLTNATWYYLKVEIVTVSTTTTLTAGIYNTSDVLQGGEVTQAYTNTSWTNNIVIGGQTSGQVNYMDDVEVWA